MNSRFFLGGGESALKEQIVKKNRRKNLENRGKGKKKKKKKKFDWKWHEKYCELQEISLKLKAKK